MTEAKNTPTSIELSKYNELEQYMPRQVILAQTQDRHASDPNSKDTPATKGLEVYESLIASVKTSALAIRELARVKQELTHQNQELQFQYEQQISELREALASEKSRASAVEIEMKTLKGAYQHRLDESSTRIQELESRNGSLSGELEKQTDETAKFRRILDYLVGEVAVDLNESLEEFNIITKDAK